MKKRLCLLLAAVLLTASLTGCQVAENLGRAVVEKLPLETMAPVAESTAPAEETEPLREETAQAPETAPEPETDPVPETDPEPAETRTPGDYVPGVRTDTGYENESLGFRFTPGENMVMASEEELEQIMSQGLDEVVEEGVLSQDNVDQSRVTTSYEMYALDPISGVNISIMVEDLPVAGITESLYMEIYRSSMEQTGLETDLKEPEDMELAGVQFLGMDGVLAYNGQEIGQLLLVKKVESRKILAVILSYRTQEGLDTLLSCFSPLD